MLVLYISRNLGGFQVGHANLVQICTPAKEAISYYFPRLNLEK